MLGGLLRSDLNVRGEVASFSITKSKNIYAYVVPLRADTVSPLLPLLPLSITTVTPTTTLGW